MMETDEVPIHSAALGDPSSRWSQAYRDPVLVDEAVVTLTEVRGIWRQEDGTPLGRLFPLSAQEEAFGDYTQGRYAWVLTDARLIEPVPLRGRQGLFNIPDLPAREELPKGMVSDG